MPVKFRCQCGKALVAREEQCGKKAKCPSCGTLVDVPSPAPPSRPQADHEPLRLAGEVQTAAPPAQQVRSGRPCPACGNVLPERAVTCEACGQDLLAKPQPTGLATWWAWLLEPTRLGWKLAAGCTIPLLLAPLCSGLYTVGGAATVGGIPLPSVIHGLGVLAIIWGLYTEQRGSAFLGLLTIGGASVWLLLAYLADHPDFERIPSSRFLREMFGSRAFIVGVIALFVLPVGGFGLLLTSRNRGVVLLGTVFLLAYPMAMHSVCGPIRGGPTGRRPARAPSVDAPHISSPTPSPSSPSGNGNRTTTPSPKAIPVTPASPPKPDSGGLVASGYYVTDTLPGPEGISWEKLTLKQANRTFLVVTLKVPGAAFVPSEAQYRDILEREKKYPKPKPKGVKEWPRPRERYLLLDPMRFAIMMPGGVRYVGNLICSGASDSSASTGFSGRITQSYEKQVDPATLQDMQVAWTLLRDECKPPFTVQLDGKAPVDVPGDRQKDKGKTAK